MTKCDKIDGFSAVVWSILRVFLLRMYTHNLLFSSMLGGISSNIGVVAPDLASQLHYERR